MANAPSIVWLRRDLRTDDHPALCAAAARGNPVLPVVFVQPETLSGPRGWWLRRSLAALAEELGHSGGRLLVRSGPAPEGLLQLVAETGAAHLDYHGHVSPHERAEETSVEQRLGAALTVTRHRAETLFGPGDVCSRSGTPYLIYTPFAKACRQLGTCPRPLPPPTTLPPVVPWPAGLDLETPDRCPRGEDERGLAHQWEPGPRGAFRRLEWLVERRVKHYHTERDRPGSHSTSGLSPHLAFGEISARRLWQALLHSRGDKPYAELPEGHRCFLDELLWREFAQHVLWHRPEVATSPLRPRFAHLAWRDDPAGLRAWQQGQTGFPMVDAGMRQLLRLGWMHNRVRMVVASFLVKDLLIDWRQGAAWFAQQLVDFDLASNSLNWQWAAGSGIDSAAFTRVFNPVAQGRRFDADGRYVRRWVPELADLPDRWLHEPAAAPAAVLAAAGVRLGETYPRPLVDHAEARQRALDAYGALR